MKFCWAKNLFSKPSTDVIGDDSNSLGIQNKNILVLTPCKIFFLDSFRFFLKNY